jgi:hypothetical protein
MTASDRARQHALRDSERQMWDPYLKRRNPQASPLTPPEERNQNRSQARATPSFRHDWAIQTCPYVNRGPHRTCRSGLRVRTSLIPGTSSLQSANEGV